MSYPQIVTVVIITIAKIIEIFKTDNDITINCHDTHVSLSIGILNLTIHDTIILVVVGFVVSIGDDEESNPRSRVKWSHSYSASCYQTTAFTLPSHIREDDRFVDDATCVVVVSEITEHVSITSAFIYKSEADVPTLWISECTTAQSDSEMSERHERERGLPKKTK